MQSTEIFAGSGFVQGPELIEGASSPGAVYLQNQKSVVLCGGRDRVNVGDTSVLSDKCYVARNVRGKRDLKERFGGWQELPDR